MLVPYYMNKPLADVLEENRKYELSNKQNVTIWWRINAKISQKKPEAVTTRCGNNHHIAFSDLVNLPLGYLNSSNYRNDNWKGKIEIDRNYFYDNACA